ncbi:hypothetical protein H6CHR_02434 [Variovorax sp. PBL-H6]|nr:hypothetical protein H6CHR_02434 [Variovorax sp. PBL-H6]
MITIGPRAATAPDAAHLAVSPTWLSETVQAAGLLRI